MAKKPTIKPVTKLEFKAYTDSGFQTEDSNLKFNVQFNPTEYGMAYELVYNNQQPQNGTNAEQHFRHAKPSKLSLTFTLDGTGAAGKDHKDYDIKAKVREFTNVVYNYQGNTHRPRYIKISWGSLEFKGVLTNMNFNYSLFDPDGNPLRAKVDVSFASALSFERQIAENSPESPDMSHLFEVKDGENLPLMAYEVYNDELKYIQVARHNQMVNFRRLKTGQRILFPPIKTEEEKS